MQNTDCYALRIQKIFVRETSTSRPQHAARCTLHGTRRGHLETTRRRAGNGHECVRERERERDPVCMPKVPAKAKAAPAARKKSGKDADNDDILVPSTNDMVEAGEVDAVVGRVKFAPHTELKAKDAAKKVEFRRVSVPQHRMTPLKNNWLALYTPVTENLKLDMRMNLKSRKVEIKTTERTPDAGNLQRAADFIHAYILGFEVNDAIALLRLDDLYIESFEVKDVKTLRGEHLARGIGRMAGKSGKTKFTIENASRTRIVLADTKIHILGSFQNIRVARDSICHLIMGSPAGKVYNRLRNVSARLNSSY